MLDAASKSVFHTLAGIDALKRLASRYGMADAGFARRFIAGESIEEATRAVQSLASRGLLLTLDYLGESVATPEGAEQATREYLHVLDGVVRTGIERNVSLKLTQLGLDIGRQTTVDNLRRILAEAAAHGFFVRIDMESSRHTDATLDIFETLWREGFHDIGIVLQACLKRTALDLPRVLALGARVRLVKGAYNEPADVAHRRKSDVNESYVRLMHVLLDDQRYHAFATHDPDILDATKRNAASQGYSKTAFEFQMLYGIRRDLQAALAAEGYRMRVYVPFGREWFPYFMRRLGERPANVAFVLKGILRDRG